MNITYTKKSPGKIYKTISSNHSTKYAEVPHPGSTYPLGDGDCMRTCRLCGGEKNLRHFQDTYVWEGNEERYDDLLYDCFGIKVTGDCMICDFCVHGLRTMEKFKALVFAAFQQDNNKNDQASPASSSNKVAITSCLEPSTGKCKLKKPVYNSTQPKQKQSLDGPRKKDTSKKWMHPEVRYKRVQCEMCKQRYPLLATSNERIPFICSRCKTTETKTVKKVSHASKGLNLYTENGHRRRPQRSLQSKSKTLGSLAKKAEMQHNAKYLKVESSNVVKTASATRRVSDDNYFYITSDEEAAPQAKLQASPEKNSSLKFIFKKTNSLTKNTPSN